MECGVALEFQQATSADKSITVSSLLDKEIENKNKLDDEDGEPRLYKVNIRTESEVRNAALEEATLVCDRWATHIRGADFHDQRMAVEHRAEEIRALKTN